MAFEFNPEEDGPFDVEDFDDPADAEAARLDLGGVLVPVPDGSQLNVEVNEQGVPNAVWIMTPNGRFSVAAYAAPKTGGLWREIAAELAESLRNDNAQARIEDGPWGREVVGLPVPQPGQGQVVMRFIGADGYRWMIRCVVVGTEETIDAIADEARTSLADTVVRRGDTPLPVRSPLPVQLSEPLLEQLRPGGRMVIPAGVAEMLVLIGTPMWLGPWLAGQVRRRHWPSTKADPEAPSASRAVHGQIAN